MKVAGKKFGINTCIMEQTTQRMNELAYLHERNAKAYQKKPYIETPQLQDIIIKNHQQEELLSSQKELSEAFTTLMSMEVKIPQ